MAANISRRTTRPQPAYKCPWPADGLSSISIFFVLCRFFFMPVPFKVDDWKAAAAQRRKLLVYPDEWKLDEQYLKDVGESSTQSVLDIPAKCGILSAKELEITETDGSKVLDQLILGKLSSYEVTLAFCKRAAIAHQLTNCLTQLFWEEALEKAKELDEAFKMSGPVGRLHGLPVSFKDSWNLEGKETTYGYVSYIGNIKHEDGLFAKCIRKAGGVPFCKTNLAQGLMIVEGQNNIFGTTLNPNNLSLSASGSSSGEGALVKMKGSPLGMGSDAGGSIRLPAASNGTFGFLPSTDRITGDGHGEGKGPITWIQPQGGPLVNDVKLVWTWAKAMDDFKAERYDPFITNMGWRDVEIPQCLTFGVIYQDGVVETTPAVLRAMKETVEKIESSGHKVVVLDIGDLHHRITEVILPMFVSNGCTSHIDAIEASGEPFIHRVGGSKSKGPMTLQQVHALDSRARQLGYEYLELFRDNQLDLIITPGMPNPPGPHLKYSTNSISAVYNMLGYAAGIVPVGVVDLVKDAPTPAYSESPVIPDPKVSEYFPYDYFDEYVKKELYTDINKFKNAPLAIQVVGRKSFDELVVRAMEIIAELV